MVFEHTCDIYRYSSVGTNGRKTQTLNQSGVSCLLLPMGDQATISLGYELGRTYDCYFPADTDVRVGDRLIYNGKKLNVSSVRDFTGLPGIEHLEVLAQMEAF